MWGVCRRVILGIGERSGIIAAVDMQNAKVANLGVLFISVGVHLCVIPSDVQSREI